MKRIPPVVWRMVPAFAAGLAVGYVWFGGWSAKEAGPARAKGARQGPAAAKPAAPANTLAWDQRTPLGKVLKGNFTGGYAIAFAQVLENAPLNAFPGLLAQVDAFPVEAQRPMLNEMLFTKWTQLDPAGALASAIKDRQRHGTTKAIETVMWAWGEIDPEAALVAARQIDNGTLRIMSTTRVFMSWVQSGDPRKAIEYIKSMPGEVSSKASLGNMFNAWSVQDPHGAWNSLGEIPDATQRLSLQNNVLRNMAAVDPQGALERARNLPPGQQSPALFGNIFSAWAKQDAQGALAAAQNLPPNASRMQAIQSVAASWAQEDPQAVINWSNTLPAGAERTKILGAGLNALAYSDPVAEAAILQAMPVGNDRDQFITHLIEQWTVSDPLAALKWVDDTLTGGIYEAAAERAIYRSIRVDPQAAAAYALQMDSARRAASLVTIAGEWAKEDPQAAMAWTQANLDGPEKATAYREVVDQMVQMDPLTATKYVMDVTVDRGAVIRALSTSLAKQDIAAALEFAQSLPEQVVANNRRLALQNVINTWAESDPASAAAYIQTSLADNPNYNALLVNAGSQWARVDGRAAMAWAANLPEGAERDQALAATLNSVATYDPVSAWEQAQTLPNPALRDSLMLQLTQAGSRQDPVTMASMVTALPPGDNRTRAVETLVGNWANQDPYRASAWISTLPAGTERDGAVGRLVTTQAAKDPAGAFNWAVTIGDDTARYNQIRTVVQQWGRMDAAAASAAIQSAPLDDEQRATLLQTLVEQSGARTPARVNRGGVVRRGGRGVTIVRVP